MYVMYSMATPCLYMYNANYYVNSHALVNSFIVFKVMNLILNNLEWKIYFRENWHIFWGIWGDAELILGILGA